MRKLVTKIGAAGLLAIGLSGCHAKLASEGEHRLNMTSDIERDYVDFCFIMSPSCYPLSDHALANVSRLRQGILPKQDERLRLEDVSAECRQYVEFCGKDKPLVGGMRCNRDMTECFLLRADGTPFTKREGLEAEVR